MLVLEEHLAKVQLQLSILVYVLDFDVGCYCDVATSSLRMNIIVFSSSNSSTKKSLTTLSCIFLLLSRTTILFLHEILNNMRQVENRPIPHESFNHLIHGVVKMSWSKFYINLSMEKNLNICLVTCVLHVIVNHFEIIITLWEKKGVLQLAF